MTAQRMHAMDQVRTAYDEATDARRAAGMGLTLAEEVEWSKRLLKAGHGVRAVRRYEKAWKAALNEYAVERLLGDVEVLKKAELEVFKAVDRGA